MKAGGMLASVHCDDSDWAMRAKDILERTGPQDVSSTGDAKADAAMPLRSPGRQDASYCSRVMRWAPARSCDVRLCLSSKRNTAGICR